ncbi:MAG: response regulator [Zhongshania sp.]|nr:response regulator [Zhongshania sp.]
MVDDRPVNVQFLNDLLGYAGYHVTTAGDGVKAMAMVKEQQPDLIITDILMPNMDGIAFTELLRANQKYKHIKIIFYSATYKISDVKKLASNCGADAVLPKPTEPRIILDTVANLLGNDIEKLSTPTNFPQKIPSSVKSTLADLDALSEMRLAHIAANDIGINVEAEKRIESLLHTNGQFAAILDLFMELASLDDADTIQQIIFEAAMKIIPSSYAAFSVIGQNDTAPKLLLHNLPKNIFARYEDNPSGLISRLSKQSGSYLIKDKLCMSDLPSDHPPASKFLGVSIKSQQSTVGWIYFATDNDDHVFSESDTRLAETLLSGGLVLYENKELQELVRAHSVKLQVEISNSKKISRDLLEASRLIGKTEATTEVLHDVGNVLNSVNVSTKVTTDIVARTNFSGLSKAVAMLRDNEKNLDNYVTNDPKGKLILGYLEDLSQDFINNKSHLNSELDGLQDTIDHMKKIVELQQDYSKTSSLPEIININEIIDISLRINDDALGRHGVKVIRELTDTPAILIDKHKTVQILVNLIVNAKQACDRVNRHDKQLVIATLNTTGGIIVKVSDNGGGINAENMTKLFNHGFTTRKEGHGFGLHSCATSSKQLGGTLTASSDGAEKGATFELELPLAPPSHIELNCSQVS